jgi:predicted metalloprotease with PDZ domain
MVHLLVTLAAQPRGVSVTWRLRGVALNAGETLGQLPLSIAGAPTLHLGEDAVTATDAQGPIPLVASVTDGGDHCWTVGRSTSGPVELSYLAEFAAEEPRAGTAPLELRREGAGFSGALKCFVILPPGPEDLTFAVRWNGPVASDGWMAVSSLGEGDGHDGELAGTGLELLGDTYVMCGELAYRHHRDGQLSTWWLTSPGIDVEAFTTRLGRTYQVMSAAFGAPAHPYRVFLRTHPHRGANASAHPASFVMALNPANPLDAASLYETIAHELVHEWLHLDGPPEDVTWFSEGAADYYSLVLPLRNDMLDESAFLHAVNFEAREAYANPRRNLSLRAAQRLFFSDFLAQRLPYARGMFYLADLDARLRQATSGRRCVDDLVRSVVRSRRDGERLGIEQWCALVEKILPETEMPVLDALAFTGVGRPRDDCFGPRFAAETVQVPVLDVGFDPSTFVTRRVQGLVPGGAADRAGLREGDIIDLPRYPEIVRLNAGESLTIDVTRDGQATRIAIPLNGKTAPVPQWRKRPGTDPPSPEASSAR